MTVSHSWEGGGGLAEDGVRFTIEGVSSMVHQQQDKVTHSGGQKLWPVSGAGVYGAYALAPI